MSDALQLDKATILDRLGGDEELFAEMANMYIAESEAYCQALADAFAAQAAERVQREAHTIKGLLATFADEAGTELALSLEHQARSGDLAGLEEKVGAVQARVRQLAAVLRAT